MESLEFHDLFAVPRLTLKTDAVAEFCVEGQHVKVHLLTINDVNGVVHVLDKHFVRITCRMYADQRFGLRRSIAFLSAVFPLTVLALITVHRVHALI